MFVMYLKRVTLAAAAATACRLPADIVYTHRLHLGIYIICAKNIRALDNPMGERKRECLAQAKTSYDFSDRKAHMNFHHFSSATRGYCAISMYVRHFMM